MHEQHLCSKNNKHKKINSFIHTLPKAIQKFEELQHQKKSIYPFKMITNTHKQMNYEQQAYSKQSTEKSIGQFNFRPTLESITAYFQRSYLLYDKFNNNKDEQLFNQNIYSIQTLKNLKHIDHVTSVQYTNCYQAGIEGTLIFNSRFQSGNLSLASYFQGVYYLLLHNDVNTSGYTSWFYFHVKNQKRGRYKFAILNYGKAGVMHNHGVKICVYNNKFGWRRACSNINSSYNRDNFKKGPYMNFYTLYFEYQFEEDFSDTYFSYNVPYTYNDLCSFLDKIQNQNLPYFFRKSAGSSLVGNKLQMLTITNLNAPKDGAELPVIILMARAHPGQTVSSWIMHQLIKFLISKQPQAMLLRNNFIFKLFPMINPDGVIHGNYRCSLSGRDLNRRWAEPNKQLYPQIYNIKNKILQISQTRTIKAIIDLHGHTKKKKIFAYGCNNRFDPYKCRHFPRIFSQLTSFFQFKFCNYYMSKCKFGTARITLYETLKIPYIYTVESSQFGTYEGHLSLKVIRQVAQNLLKSFLILFKIRDNQDDKNPQMKSKICWQKFENFQSQLMNDPNLLKIGAEKDSGSQSEPSVDNIKFDRLSQMLKRKQMKINSFTSKFNGRSHNSGGNSQSIQKIQKTVQIRPKTSQIRAKRYVQQETKKATVTIKSEQKQFSFKNRVRSEKAERKFCSTRPINFVNKSINSTKKRTQALNFINLSLSILDDNNHKSQRVGSIITQKFRQFNQNLFNKMKFGPKNCFHFRRFQ